MPEASLVGRTIAQRYCIEELVGGGAMGDVYRARHVGLGNDVALKIMRPSFAGESSFKERFYREARAASRLEHPNSVRVLDYGQEADGLVYLVMEFLRGRDLLEVIEREWPLSDERIVDILAQTLGAISTAHGHGIVHRDLKPENIMILPDEDDEHRDCVKVCDFGIAKLIDARAYKSHEDVKTALTTNNAIIGTPEYMSPEQARGEALDARSDLYSVGVILYRMLTKQLPFDAENAIGLAVKHVMEEPVPPSRLVPRVNPRLESICLRALRKDPRDRHATAKEMRAELRTAIGFPAASPSNPAWLETPPPGALPASLVRPLAELEAAPTAGHEVASNVLAPNPPPTRRLTASDTDDAVVPMHSSRLAAALTALAVLGALGVAGGTILWTRSSSGDDTRGAGIVARAPESAAPPSSSPLALVSPTTADSPPSARGPVSKPTAHAAARPPAAAPITSAAPGHVTPAPPPAPSPARTQTPPAPSTSASASPPPGPTSDYKPTSALVAREPLVVERVQRDVLERRLAELAPRLNECYRDALFIVGAPVGGRADIHMSIDAAGHVVSVVSSPQLPPFQRCASRVLSTLSVPPQAVEAGGGTAEQGLKLTP